MKIIDNGTLNIDWSSLESNSVNSQSGSSKSKTIEYGDIRIRTIEYSPEFVADHWCPKGHIIFVLDGEILLKLKNGNDYRINKGMSFICGDNDANPHAAYSKNGASILIID